MQTLLNERDLGFLLYELLDTEALLERERYRDHSRAVFDATLETARQIAERYFAPFAAKGDEQEPQLVGGRVQLIPEAKAAWDAFADAGFLRARFDAEEGGLQLPQVIADAAMCWFNAATVGLSAYPMLTGSAANLIRAFGDNQQRATYFAPMIEGRWSGTMALTEPAQGSALADIKTSAEPQADGSYRIFGSKIFISGGEQEITENIVHMVIARIKGAPAGTRGISLFIVPKFIPDGQGRPGIRNDIALSGLLHKMGWRQTSSTALSFGAAEGAVGYLLGEPHRGLGYMFQMMNEARIGVGLFAAATAYHGYLCALDYARQRPQGRLPSSKDPASPQIRLVDHADVRRLLLAQKSYAEGALALCLYAGSLDEDRHTHPDLGRREDAHLLLELLTPVVKSWPARYGAQCNDHAIQVLGGSGYMREYPVERLYRDQRLNQIHEGAEAIHGIDLLGRKLSHKGGAALLLFQSEVTATLQEAAGLPDLKSLSAALAARLQGLIETTWGLLLKLEQDPDQALANATLYLDSFGRVTVAWLWLRQALVAQRRLEDTTNEADRAFYSGKVQAARYYLEWELPQVDVQLPLLSAGNPVPYDMREAWF